MSRHRTLPAGPVGLAACIATCCLAAAAAHPAAADAPLTWEQWHPLPAAFDVGGPLPDGTLVAAATGLVGIDPGGAEHPLASAFSLPSGVEDYIAVAPGGAARGAECSFATGDIYALQIGSTASSVVRVDEGGQTHRLAELTSFGTPDGILFDTGGRFANRLLVTTSQNGHSAVLAIDCLGKATTVAEAAPLIEGGLAIAPQGFGTFGGDLVGPDEVSGHLVAVDPSGHGTVIADSGVPVGGDIGVESAGFVPPGFLRGGHAYLADRGTPGNAHPGTDTVLRLDAAALASAGVKEGDLLAATEGGALVVDVHCAPDCTVRTVAMGDPKAHGEGHLLLVAESQSTAAPSPGASPGATSGGPTVAAVPTGATPSGGSGGKIAIAVVAVVVVVGVASLVALRRRV